MRNCGQQSGYTGCYEVTAIAGEVIAENSLLASLECQSAEMFDSRVIGSITASINYNDVLLRGVPPGGTTGQALEKASNDDFDTSWESLV